MDTMALHRVLKMCAKMYELSLEERLANYESSESDEEEGDE